jgi:hypothetical protein
MFVDKKEWYLTELFKMWLNNKTEDEVEAYLESQPYHEEIVELEDNKPNEVSQYLKVIGNIHENPELIPLNDG